MISIVSNNMIRFNIKSIANYLLFPKNEVHYIGGAEILPAPLSSEEENLLLTHLDDDVLEARQTLIEHNLRLVVYIAKKFDNTGILYIILILLSDHITKILCLIHHHSPPPSNCLATPCSLITSISSGTF